MRLTLVLVLLLHGLVVLAPDLRQIDGRLWEHHVYRFHRVRHDLRYRQIAKPLVVRGDYVPRRLAGTGGADRIFERCDVVVPQRALGIVGLANLPVPLRILQPLGKARELSFLADVQEEFQDRCAVVGSPVSNSRMRL